MCFRPFVYCRFPWVTDVQVVLHLLLLFLLIVLQILVPGVATNAIPTIITTSATRDAQVLHSLVIILHRLHQHQHQHHLSIVVKIFVLRAATNAIPTIVLQNAILVAQKIQTFAIHHGQHHLLDCLKLSFVNHIVIDAKSTIITMTIKKVKTFMIHNQDLVKLRVIVLLLLSYVVLINVV